MFNSDGSCYNSRVTNGFVTELRLYVEEWKNMTIAIHSAIQLIMILGVIFLPLAASAQQGDGGYAKKLPAFTLKDPMDNAFTSKELARRGMVLVVTAPIQRNEGAQKGWDEQLRNAKSTCRGKLVFLEDMTPSDFKSIAIGFMKRDYTPGAEPILLLDHDGKIRESLNVEVKKTVVLVYNSRRRLVYADAGPPSAASAQKIWSFLKR